MPILASRLGGMTQHITVRRIARADVIHTKHYTSIQYLQKPPAIVNLMLKKLKKIINFLSNYLHGIVFRLIFALEVLRFI